MSSSVESKLAVKGTNTRYVKTIQDTEQIEREPEVERPQSEKTGNYYVRSHQIESFLL